MKRFVLTGLTFGFLVSATTPAFALSDRFDDARQDTINRLSDRFDDARQDTINRLTSSSLERLH